VIDTRQVDDRGTGARVRVLVVDDHDMLADSLSTVLDSEPDIEAVGVVGTIGRARTAVATLRPDVVLLDHRLPDGEGVAAIPGLLALHPAARIIVLTASPAEQLMIDAIDAGAVGFISKSRSLDEIRAAVRLAAAGESVISPELLARLLPRLGRRTTQTHQGLTEREREILELVAEGLSNAVIAERLVVSVHTVRNHVANISAKLGAHSKLEVLVIAVREGLLPGG
jgi:DNA-binding NarL/FixJ family response regulator